VSTAEEDYETLKAEREEQSLHAALARLRGDGGKEDGGQ
jgi:hypothetical protein